MSTLVYKVLQNSQRGGISQKKKLSQFQAGEIFLSGQNGLLHAFRLRAIADTRRRLASSLTPHDSRNPVCPLGSGTPCAGRCLYSFH